MFAKWLVPVLQKKWIQLMGMTMIILGTAFCWFFAVKLLVWIFILFCFLSPLYHKQPPYHIISLIILILLFTIRIYFFFKPIQSPEMLISRPLPFNHHCSPPFLAVLTDFHEIENKCVQTALSAIRHFRPDIYTLVIVFPLVIIFLLWQKKILGSIYQRIPNTRFELTGYILGTFFFYLSPFFLRPVLRATVNSLIWGLALFLMSWPHPFEMAVLMGLASLLPYWGIWFGFLFPLSILWHEPVQFTRLIEFVIAMAVLWLTNYLVTFFKTENPTKLSDKFFYLAYLSVAFILFNCDGLLGFGVLFSFATFLHPYLTNGIRLLRQPAVKS